jgi:hypothetical protein
MQPLVVVRLWHGSRQVQLTGLVDSGADSSLLDVGYADLLGLDRADATTEQSVGASGEAFDVLTWPEGLLELQFGTQRMPYRGSFMDFGATGDGVNLLGRRDFFARFIIQFWDDHELMNIDLSPDFPTGDAVAQLKGSP